MSPKHWLMKAEPDSRIVKGKDVKFSVEDFEAVKTTPWEGVRNAEARNLMKEMKIGDNVLFYHSNCKNPGIAAFAQVSKQAYPDYTAWDSSHPYYDPKTDQDNPKWYMVEVSFVSRAHHFVPLSLLRSIAASQSVPEDVTYIGKEGTQAIKGMTLVTRGRLSVQRVEEEAWNVIEQLAERGGWEEGDRSASKSKARARTKAAGKPTRGPANQDEEDPKEEVIDQDTSSRSVQGKQPNRRKRKAKDVSPTTDDKPRRSTRTRR